MYSKDFEWSQSIPDTKILTYHKVSTPSFVCATEFEMEHSPLSPENFYLLQATSALFCLRSKIILCMATSAT